jgi:hypothetical protein
VGSWRRGCTYGRWVASRRTTVNGWDGLLFGGKEMLSFADLHALHRRRFVLQSNRMLTTNTLVNVHWCPLLVIWIDLLETVSRLFLFRHVPSDSESPPGLTGPPSLLSHHGCLRSAAGCASRDVLCREREHFYAGCENVVEKQKM